MKKMLFCFVCFWTLSCGAVTAKLNHSVVQPGESVELIFSDNKPIDAIDLSPLNKNFMLGGQSQGQSSQYINGVGSTTYQKSIILFPLKEGTIQIPALTVGSEQTAPLTLTIQKEGKNAPSSDLHLPKLTAQLSNNAPYIGQSFFYILRLSDQEELAEAELLPNFPEGLKLTSIEPDTEKVENGKVFLERRYLMKTEKAGLMEILPALLNGMVLYKKNQKFHAQGIFSILNASEIMDAFSTGTKPIQIISNPVSLEVKEKPSDWEGWWLPTTGADLKVAYQIPENLKAGDTFKATFTLTAQDVDSHDLPVPKLANHPQFRYYPQPEERALSPVNQGHFQGSVQITYEIMPLEEGNLILPEVSIPWFNTRLGKKEIAKTQALPLNVQAGQIETFLKPQETPAIQPTPEIPEPQNAPVKSARWPYFLIAAVGGIGLILFLILKVHKRKKAATKKEKPIPDFYPF